MPIVSLRPFVRRDEDGWVAIDPSTTITAHGKTRDAAIELLAKRVARILADGGRFVSVEYETETGKLDIC